MKLCRKIDLNLSGHFSFSVFVYFGWCMGPITTVLYRWLQYKDTWADESHFNISFEILSHQKGYDCDLKGIIILYLYYMDGVHGWSFLLILFILMDTWHWWSQLVLRWVLWWKLCHQIWNNVHISSIQLVLIITSHTDIEYWC